MFRDKPQGRNPYTAERTSPGDATDTGHKVQLEHKSYLGPTKGSMSRWIRCSEKINDHTHRLFILSP